jgi:hypothetical protein
MGEAALDAHHTVLSCLSLTTTPCSVRFGIFDPLLSWLASRARSLARFCAAIGLDPRDVAPHHAHRARILELFRSPAGSAG